MSDKKNVMEKLKSVLDASDLAKIEEAIESKIADSVKLLKEEYETELKKKTADLEKLSEEYVAKTVSEKLEEEKAALVESYDAKLEAIEKKVATKLSSYLDHVIVEQISNETLQKIAINETALPLVQKIQKLFAESYVELDVNGKSIVDGAQKKVKDLEAEVSTYQKKLMESEERLQNSVSLMLITEKCDGLTATQKKRVVSMFKNKKFEDVQANIDNFVSMIKESVQRKPVIAPKKTIDEVISEGDAIPEAKQVIEESVDEFSEAEKYLQD